MLEGGVDHGVGGWMYCTVTDGMVKWEEKSLSHGEYAGWRCNVHLAFIENDSTVSACLCFYGGLKALDVFRRRLRRFGEIRQPRGNHFAKDFRPTTFTAV